jgi:hypothetical protein
MKGNFNVKKIDELVTPKNESNEIEHELTESEFEDFIRKSGSAGSFVVFRSDENKESELGIDEV